MNANRDARLEFDYGASWDDSALTPGLGEGEYTVRLFGPTEHTAWTMIYDVVYWAPDPMVAARELVVHRQAELVTSLPRWRVTVQVGKVRHDDENADLPVLVGIWNPGSRTEVRSRRSGRHLGFVRGGGLFGVAGEFGCLAPAQSMITSGFASCPVGA
jgi:hypothetical protein